MSQFKKILITGGAGFVGSSLAVLFRKAFTNIQITSFDNLKRRGGELNLLRLKEHNIEFVHGDIRCREDLEELNDFDLLIDCSAEASVLAGITGSPLPIIMHNLLGTINCIEECRKRNSAFMFLSTSRVYPIEAINELSWKEGQSRYIWTADNDLPGFSQKGISEEFSTNGARSIYGATKLSGELILQEYAYSYKMPAMINRCGILTGPWQMGKVDQGVVTLWVARHIFNKNLKYIGFGGTGKQVRDMLHVDDLFGLILKQASKMELWDGRSYNVGGGNAVSSSLLELTNICEQITGKKIIIEPKKKTSSVDIRIYISDTTKVQNDFGWTAQRDVPKIVTDITKWITNNYSNLETVFFEKVQ
ncbi:NAD-dependent epimerase/dehydratase family protein [Thermodesulfobacteriota bacterium]